MTHQGRGVHDSPWQGLYDSSKSDQLFMTRQGRCRLCNAGLCGICNACVQVIAAETEYLCDKGSCDEDEHAKSAGTPAAAKVGMPHYVQ